MDYKNLYFCAEMLSLNPKRAIVAHAALAMDEMRLYRRIIIIMNNMINQSYEEK